MGVEVLGILLDDRLTATESSLGDLNVKFKQQDEEVKALRKLAEVERLERDERQQAFSETIHQTLQMLIAKMDSLGTPSARNTARSSAAGYTARSSAVSEARSEPPAPLPMRSRASEVAAVSGPPPPFLGKISLRRGA